MEPIMNLEYLFKSAVARHVAVIESVDCPSLKIIYDIIRRTYLSGHRIYVAGNGGSAADAQHIAAELVGRFKRDRRALSAIALTTDTSCLTAISNDYDFDSIFERQIEGHFREGDLLWVLSVSGSSPNIVRAVAAAKKAGGHIVLFTGKKCTDLLTCVDAAFVAGAESSDVVQECHQFAYHLLCDWIELEMV